MAKPMWTYCTSVYLPKKHCTVYRDDTLGVQLQVEVKRDWTFFPPKERSYFFIDGDAKVFRSESSLVRELERARAGRSHPHRSPTRRRASLGEGQGMLSHSPQTR